ncbi:MAG: Npt1/Npt2 family nucleotide transporter [Pseudomonadota bacterium]
MVKFLGKLLEIYEDEISLFLWATVLLFLIRSSDILFNNFAETAFLKRFGVEYLPMIFMINAVSTFFIMGLLTGIIARMPGSRLLSYSLVVCGVSVAALRLVVPLGFDLIYPVLYVLKSQYEVLLGLFFWNLANDLFNTRQSKRLFPLITAGGVMGGIIGSFGTPILARQISIDNLMWVYLGTTLAGAMVVKRMGSLFPTLLLPEKKGKKVKARPTLREEFKKVLPLIKESDLVKILIFLTLLPNVVVPIINFQFNYAIDQTFATEGGMIKFFGYFRGAQNIISFIILLFVGRLYGRWGLPVALMFHPFNYIIAFLAFLFRFDILSAMYARLSTIVLRNTINNPARAILMGLFPAEYRGIVRPFLRGTVVRVGTLIGSGFILVFEGFIHPRFLSLIAICFVSLWIISTFVLKKRYSQILLDLISRNMLDLKSMEEKDVSHLFLDKKIQSQLVEAFLSTRGGTCLWYANLMKSLGIENLDSHILSIIKEQDEKTKIGLLDLISAKAGEKAMAVLKDLADPNKPDLMIGIIKAANRLPIKLSSKFNLEVFKTQPYPKVKAYALAGLYPFDPKKCKNIISSWIESGAVPERIGGVIAAGESGDDSFAPRLMEMLDREPEGSVLPFLIRGLHHLKGEGIKSSVMPYLIHPLESVRFSVLEAIQIEDDRDLRTVVGLMDDPSERIQELAKAKIESAQYQNARLLVESLSIPRRKVREGLFHLLESMSVSDVDTYRFAESQLQRAYTNLAEAEALRLMKEIPERDLLIDHMIQKKNLRVETILRVLAIQDPSGRMRVIWRGVFSSDSRQRSNALEALDDMIGHSLSKSMMPLLEDLPPTQSLDIGRQKFQLPKFDSNPRIIFTHLLEKHDWVTVVLTLHLMGRQGFDGLGEDILDRFGQAENPNIRKTAQMIAGGKRAAIIQKERDMEANISIPDKILHLRNIQIFEGLSVGELAAIASITEEAVYPKDATVIKEGEPGETMYLIISGEVSVIKGQEGGSEIELDRIHPGGYFGEMALFEDTVRSATIRTLNETCLLVLNKHEFTEIVREYPQIALHICKELSSRLRKSHEIIKSYEKDKMTCDLLPTT